MTNSTTYSLKSEPSTASPDSADSAPKRNPLLDNTAPEAAPIRTSAIVHWRQFRHRAAPYVVFIGVLIAAALLWGHQTGPAQLVGKVEAVRLPIAATKAGTIVALKVDLLQHVKRGDVLAEIVLTDAEALRAGFLSNVESLRAQLQQSSDRASVSFQQFRLDWMRRRIELASARVDLQYAENELARVTALHNSHILSDADYDAKLKARDALKVKVDTLSQLTSDLEQQISRAESETDKSDRTPTERAIAAATVKMEKELEAQTVATVLRAPIDGIVSALPTSAGQAVKAGETVATLSIAPATRITAYQRQPLRRQLHPGDKVRVRSRGTLRTAEARIVRIGEELEQIEPDLLPVVANGHVVREDGLPLLIDLPRSLGLLPGETVDLLLQR